MKKIKKRHFVLLSFGAVMLLAAGCAHIPRTKPGAPTNLVATAVAYNQINLTWQDNADNEDGFRVGSNIYGGSTYFEIADLPANTTSFEHSGLDPLETYRYYVQAYNDIGEANSNEVEATTLSGVTILNYVLGERWNGNAFVTGHARNDTNEEMDWVTITVWYYNAFNVLLDAAHDLIDDIPGETTFEFEVRGSAPRVNVARFDIEVTDVDIYDWTSLAKENEKEMRPESEWGLNGK